MAPNQLSTVERQILTNQFRILISTASDAKSKRRYERNLEILERGITGLYHLVFDVAEEANSEVSNEVHQILNTFNNIQELVETLEPAEKKGLDQSQLRFGGISAGTHHQDYLKFAIEHTDLGKSINKRSITANGDENPIDRYRQIVQYEDRALKRLGYLRKKDLQNILNFV